MNRERKINKMNDDTISRQAAIDAICEHGTDLERRGITVLAVANYKQVTVDLLENLPSAERRGQWKDIPFTARWICSNCDYISEFASFKYCPDCGAKMDDDWEEPAINPCQGCEDYDGRGGCTSKGGCGAKMDEVEE